MTISTPTVSGQILTSAYVNNNINSGMVYVTSYTVGSGVSTFSVPDCFNSSYDNYRVIYTGGTGTGTSAGLRLSLTGSTTTYFNMLIFGSYATGSLTGISNNASLGYWQYAGAVDSNSNAFLSTDIFEPFVSRSTRFAAQWVQTDAAGTNQGIHKSNTSYTGITVVPDSGTLTGGTVTVYGYRKA